MNARPIRRPKPRPAPRWNCRCAGPSADIGPTIGEGRASARNAVRHRPGRRARRLRLGLARRHWRTIGFAGLAVGGLAVGETEAEREHVLEALMPQMPLHKPRYLMGVGRPQDILEAVRRGIDMFDCVMPTRHARNGHLFTRDGRHQHPQCRASEGHRPDRGGLRLLHLPQLQPQLPEAPRQVRRDPRHRASIRSTTCTSTSG